MLFACAEVQELLRQIIHRVAADCVLHEDLMQEALTHLWQQESQRPGQSRSWYLQSCRFHLQNHLEQGRSLDSMKRRQGRCSLSWSADSAECVESELGYEESTWESVSVRDIFQSLSERVKPCERSTLVYLADGFGVREIARKLRVSHQAVSKHRQRIATLAIQLGLLPLAAYA